MKTLYDLVEAVVPLVGATVGVLVVALALPVSESTRNQVVTLIGVLISGDEGLPGRRLHPRG